MQKLKVKNLKSKNTKINLQIIIIIIIIIIVIIIIIIIIIIKTTFASPDRNFRTAHVSNFRKWYFFNRKSPSQVFFGGFKVYFVLLREISVLYSH